MSEWGEFASYRNRPRKAGRMSSWRTTRIIEEALIKAEPAAEWLRTHPPGARLPDALEPGYEPEEYVPETDGPEG